MPKLRVIGGDKVIEAMRRHRDKNSKLPRVEVGYAAHYAAYVHENLAIPHRNGQAKYLEIPLRLYRNKMSEMIRIGVRQRDLKQGLLNAGNFLKVESQKLVPVDTGILRASAYVKIV